MIILEIAMRDWITLRGFVYIPIFWDVRYTDYYGSNISCTDHNPMWKDDNVYSGVRSDYHNRRIARERNLYCSVIDCAM